YMMDLEGKWVEATVTNWAPDHHYSSIFLQTQEAIRGGFSGGPVVNSVGEIVGVVSEVGGYPSGDDPEIYFGGGRGIPLAHLALPVWVCRRIFDAQHG